MTSRFDVKLIVKRLDAIDMDFMDFSFEKSPMLYYFSLNW